MAATHACKWQPKVADPCVVMLQVVENEGLQEAILHIFQELLGDKVHFTPSKTGLSMPDISGTVEEQTVLLVGLKTDSGGDARLELLVRSSPCQPYPLFFVHCFLAVQLHWHLCALGGRSLRLLLCMCGSVRNRAMLQGYYMAYLDDLEQEGDLLQQSCMPVLYVEISCAVLCVGGFAAIGCKMLSEPLMQPLQLYRSNCQKHMLALSRTMAAIRLTLGSLAAEQQAAFTAISPELHWAGRPWLLYQGEYETWAAEMLWGDTVYLLTRQQAAAGSQSAEGVAAGAGTQPGKLVAKT